jgi:LytS/YehU family sensor histidine kinase
MQWPLILDIARNVGLIGIIAYLTTRLPAVRHALSHSSFRSRDKLILALVFGGFSAFGNFLGIPVMGSMANTRIVGPIAGGLIGGVWVGVGAGLLGAIPRYFMGGFTMWASVIANIIAGLISGLAYWKFRSRRLELPVALVTGFCAEVILKLLVLLLSEPFERAWELEKIIGIPTIIANTLAVGLFIYIVRDVFQEQDKVQAKSAQQSMRLIQQSTELLSEGLNPKTAAKIVRIIWLQTNAAAVALTDTTQLLGFIGTGQEHHVAGSPLPMPIAAEMAANAKTIIPMDKQAWGCKNHNCNLTGLIMSPLIVDGTLRGALLFFKANEDTVTPYEMEMVQGIADFLSLMLDKRQLDEQKIMLSQAEYNMLKAQVNPHFLFNTLGTIRALVRTAPEKARARIKDLSDFLRRSLERTFVRLEQSRFGDRIRVSEMIQADLTDVMIPVFTLQPIMENAIKHGLAAKRNGGSIQLRIQKNADLLQIDVEDDGAGISAERLCRILQFDGGLERSSAGTGIGLNNIQKRIQTAFGAEFGLRITSHLGTGTLVQIELPIISRKEE